MEILGQTMNIIKLVSSGMIHLFDKGQIVIGHFGETEDKLSSVSTFQPYSNHSITLLQLYIFYSMNKSFWVWPDMRTKDVDVEM
jgi:hypothetical protein